MVYYRLTIIEKKLDRTLEDFETRISKLEIDGARMAERLTIAQIGQGALTLVASVLAAVFHRP